MSMDKKIEKKKGLKRRHYFMIVGVLALAFLIYLSVKAAGESVYRADEDKLSISKVTKDVFIDYITLIGNVEPITTIYLDLEEAGIVEEILIEEGEMVRQGDVILELKNTNLTTTILNQESRLAYEENDLRKTAISLEQQKIRNKQDLFSKRLKLKQAERAFSQDKVLFEKGLMAKENFLRSRESFEYAETDLELFKQRVVQDSISRETQMARFEQSFKSQQENLRLVRKRLDNLNVRAPADGQLGMLNAEIGQSLHNGQRIGLLHILDAFKVVAPVDEHYIDRVKKNLHGSIERQDVSYDMYIKKVYPEVRNGSFEVDLVFDGSEPASIRTGQSYYIKLELGESSVGTLLPKGGFFQSTGGQWVFVVDPSGSFAIKRNIKIGRHNNDYYEVLEGLDPGEQVITSNYDVFGKNDKIVFK
ncbi:MAG: biotin/lipoyl-binding protein [Bacteroidales bacterium]|nr:biotin/lipoyl-binding protein [Bacteroidales bacterium]